MTLKVRALERFVAPPTPARISTRPDGTPLVGRVIAGAGAGFDVDAQPRGPALVEIEDRGLRLLRVASLGEQRQSPPLTIGARVTVMGVVLDDQGQPLPGASVWFGERSADGVLRSFLTDELGAFEADVPAGAGVPFVVRAAGYASTWRAISAPVAVVGGGASARSDALRVMLEPSRTIHLQVAGRAVEIGRARAFVLPAVEAVSSGVSQWPFFVQALDDGYAIDADGRAVISGLPQRGSVRLVVRHPMAALRSPVLVELSATRTPVTVPLTFGGPIQRGRVVDEGGRAVQAAWLFGRRPGQPLRGSWSTRFLPPYADLRGLRVARPGDNGAFAIGTSAAAAGELAIRAPGFAGRDVPLDTGMQAEIVLARWRGGDASLVVAAPAVGVAWRLVSDLGGGVEVACDADEPGVLALPHCGRFAVDARFEGDDAAPVERGWPSLAVTGPVEVDFER